MNPKATVLVRTLSRVQGSDRAKVPARALSDYFRAWGVEIQFQQGTPLEEDPTDDSATMQAFCEEHAPVPGSASKPAVLVVTDMATDGEGTNGLLMDLASRGACAVYAESWVFSNRGPEDRFEVYAHELGHLLNLTHALANESFPTVMDQWGERSTVLDRAQLWRDAISGAGSDYATQMRSFFGDGTRSPLGLPMSEHCCRAFRELPPSKVEPWGEPFIDPGGVGPEDRAFGKVGCSLEMHPDMLTVAQPLNFALVLRLNPGAGACDIPSLLDLRSGQMVLILVDPDGIDRKIEIGSRSCGATRRRLRPGQVVRRNYSILSDTNGLLLTRPGPHRLQARVPSLGADTPWIDLEVAPALKQFGTTAFQEFLRRGLPSRSGQGWAEVEDVLSDRDVPASTRAYLATVGAARRTRAFQPARQLRALAAPRIVERDVLLRIAAFRKHGDEAALHRAIDVAELVFKSSDSEHPTLSYLRHLRNIDYVGRSPIRRGQ